MATTPPYSPRQALRREITEVRLRYDATNNECTQVQAKIDAIRDRATAFVNTDDLTADAGDDAAGIAELEAELEWTAARVYEAWETRKTHEQVIKRLKAEAVTYPRDLEGIDRTALAKDHDHGTLQLSMVKAVPKLGSCVSSGRAWRLWAPRHYQGRKTAH